MNHIRIFRENNFVNIWTVNKGILFNCLDIFSKSNPVEVLTVKECMRFNLFN